MKSLLPIVLVLVACNQVPKAEEPKPTFKDSTSIQYASLKRDKGEKVNYGVYCNGRFGYCIDYPKGILFPQPESQNGDGRVFKDKAGEEVLSVFGRIPDGDDGNPISLEQQYDIDIHGGEEPEGSKFTLTYQKLSKSFFVISGYANGKIFYQKTILKDGNFAYAILKYDESQKSRFDDFSEKLFRSFK
jgi:hypothetical protein